jgi:chromosome segregation ATPase
MGGVLEIGKIVTAVWLHRNWKSAPFMVKSYLSFATLVLMGITSMGIFGFLSRAHIEHQTSTDKAIAEVSVIDNKILRENQFIERQTGYIELLQTKASQKNSSSRLDIDSENQKIRDITEQMNKDISFEQDRISKENEKLISLNKELQELENSRGGLFSNKSKKVETLKAEQKSTRESISKNVSQYNNNIESFRSIANSKIKDIEDKITQFRNQSEEKDTTIQPQIDSHTLKISEAYGRIDKLETEKIGFSDSARKLEAEVGPVKYVAEAIADFTGKEFNISQAVRIVIIILVLVFDPLAILLVIAANISIMKNFKIEDKNLQKIEDAKSAAAQDLENITKELNSKTEKLSVYLEEENELKISNEKLEKNCSKVEKKLAEINAELNFRQSEINQLESSKIDLDQEIKLTTLKISQLEEDFSKKNELANLDKLDLEKQKVELAKNKEHLAADKTLFETEKTHLDQTRFKLKESISSLEVIIEQLNKEKKKVADEKRNLESNCEVLTQRAESQKSLIENLKKSYNESLQNGTIKDIFEALKVHEVVQILDGGQKLVSIQDENKRIHQFLIQKGQDSLPHQNYHSIVKNLLKIVDPDDLRHEYQEEVKKYIRSGAPEYNCLT